MQPEDRPVGDWLRDFPPRRWHLLAAGACLAALYLGGVSAKWWPTPDSAMIMGLGRSLAEGSGYRFNGQTHNTLTPGMPLVLAGLRLAFGPADWVANLLLALCGLGAILVTYVVVAGISDRRLALAVALCTGLSYVFFHNTQRVLTDIPFTLLFWGILYGCLRLGKGGLRWLVPVALLTAASIAVRFPAVVPLAVLVGAVALGRQLIGPWRRRLAAAATISAVATATCGAFYLLARAATGETPIYLAYADRALPTGPVHALRLVGDGLTKMPNLLTEILTSQDGTIPAILIGLPALLLLVLGVVSFVRTGRRDLAALVVLVPVAMALTCGEGKLRVRYLLPIQALLVYATLEGLLWTVHRLRTARSNPARPLAHLVAATSFAVVVVGSNLPRVCRNAFYYGYLSRTPRYYEVLREGGHAELFLAAEALKRGGPPDGLVAAPAGRVSLLHYLSRRVIVRFPANPRETAADAKQIADFVIPDEKLQFVVLDLQTDRGPFLNHLRAAVEGSGRFRPLYQGRHYRIYRRVQVAQQ